MGVTALSWALWARKGFTSFLPSFATVKLAAIVIVVVVAICGGGYLGYAVHALGAPKREAAAGKRICEAAQLKARLKAFELAQATAELSRAWRESQIAMLQGTVSNLETELADARDPQNAKRECVPGDSRWLQHVGAEQPGSKSRPVRAGGGRNDQGALPRP